MDLEKMKALLKGLMPACPFGEETGSCPAAELRGLPLQESMAAVDTMGPEIIEQILLFHQSCLRRKTGREGRFC